MGQRAVVRVRSGGDVVQVYTQWGSSRLPEVLQAALGEHEGAVDLVQTLVALLVGRIDYVDHVDLDYSPVLIDCDLESVRFPAIGGYVEVTFHEFLQLVLLPATPKWFDPAPTEEVV